MYQMSVFTEPRDTEDHALERALSTVSFQALRHNFSLRFHAFDLRAQAIPSAPPMPYVCVCDIWNSKVVNVACSKKGR